MKIKFASLFQQSANIEMSRPNALQESVTQESVLADALQSAYVVPDATPALRERVALLAVQRDQQRVMTPHRHSHRLWRGLRQLACLAACACLLVSVVAWPNIKTAYLLYRMQSAILNAHTVHVMAWNFDAQGNSLEREVWHQDGDWRVETQNGQRISVFLKSIKFRMTRGVPAPTDVQTRWPSNMEWVGGISLTQTPLQAAAYGLFSRLQQATTYDLNGRPTDIYEWQPSYYDKPHTVLWLDARTHLPMKIDVEAQGKHGVWRFARTYIMTYDKPLSATKFISQ